MATEIQSHILPALEALQFQVVPDDSGKVGGIIEMTATDEALDALKGKTVEIHPNGTVTLK